jgi:hypothetical protein
MARGGDVTVDPDGSEQIEGANTFTVKSGSDARIVCDGSGFYAVSRTSYANPGIASGRITLTSGTPVTTSDVTAAGTIYFTPFDGNQISLYDGSDAWVLHEFSEMSISVPSDTNTNHDVFLDYNDGAPQLATTAWSNDTTRATALATQDGVPVKSGDTQQRYIGTIRTTGVSGETEDSGGGSNTIAKRFVWNYYNRVKRPVAVFESAVSWSYTTNAWRQMNANANIEVQFVIGRSSEPVSFHAIHIATGGGVPGGAIGIDSFTRS